MRKSNLVSITFFCILLLIIELSFPICVNAETIKYDSLDRVTSVQNDEVGLKRVVRTFVHETEEIVHLTVDGEKLDTTTTHPFYVEGYGFKPAGELTRADRVRLFDGTTSRIDSIHIEHLDTPVKVYNFEVEDWHTYYVGEPGALVHNICDGGNKIGRDSGSDLGTAGENVGKGGSNVVSWSNHGYKHFPNKNQSWKDIVKSTKTGPAKYSFDIQDVEAFERAAWESGTPVTNGKNWRVNKYDTTIGAVNGKEAVYVRIENSSNTIHGHPISESEYNKLLKEH